MESQQVKLTGEERRQLAGMILSDLERLQTNTGRFPRISTASLREFTLPDTDTVLAWIDSHAGEIKASALALTSDPFDWKELGDFLRETVKAVQDFSAAGLPGLARADVAAGVAQWAVRTFAPKAYLNTYMGSLFANSVLPALVKVAWIAAFPEKARKAS